MGKYTMNDLKLFLLLYGNDTDLLKYEVSLEVAQELFSISQIDTPDLSSLSLPIISLSNIRKNTQEYFNYLFKTHKIGYMSHSSYETVFKNRRLCSTGEFIDYYNYSSIKIDPFLLPVHFMETDFYNGSLVVLPEPLSNEKDFSEILNKINIYFEKILLPKLNTSMTAVTYIHEIAHTQLASKKGIIRDYYNMEVLSIFIELLYAFELDANTFQFDLVDRINQLLVSYYSMYLYENSIDDDYDDYDYCANSQYLLSTLKAFSLFKLYLLGSNKQKNEILRYCQNVFDADQSLEELLNHFEIYGDNISCSSFIKTFIKS